MTPAQLLRKLQPLGSVLIQGQTREVCRTETEIEHFLEINPAADFLVSGEIDGRTQNVWYLQTVDGVMSQLPVMAKQSAFKASPILNLEGKRGLLTMWCAQFTPSTIQSPLERLHNAIKRQRVQGSENPGFTLPVKHVHEMWTAQEQGTAEYVPPQLVDISEFDENELPKREWVVPGLLMRGAVTTLAAKGGTGKSALTLHVGMMVCTGMDWAYWEVERGQSGKVLVLSSEDNLNEMRRRLAALCRMLDIDRRLLNGKLHTLDTNRFRMFSRNRDGILQVDPLFDHLKKLTKDQGFKLVVFDPFISIHSLKENAGEDMEEVVNRQIELAVHSDLAVLNSHHNRKGGTGDDQDSMRGSTAIINHSRIGIGMETMTVEEARLVLPESEVENYLDYVKVFNPKGNYARRAAMRWLQIEEIEVGQYGDTAPALKAAEFKKVTAGTWEHLNAFLRAVEAGNDGRPWLASPKGAKAGTIRELIGREEFGLSKQQQKDILGKLLKEGTLKVESWDDPIQRKPLDVVRVDESIVTSPPNGQIPF